MCFRFIMYFTWFYGMYLFGRAILVARQHKNDSPKRLLTYHYLNLLFGVTLAALVFEDVVKGLVYAFIVATISQSFPFVRDHLLQVFGLVSKPEKEQ